MPANTTSWPKGKSGNPKGCPPGSRGLERLIGGIPVGELSLQETEVRERFRILNEIYNWFHVAYSQVGFPDFLLLNGENEAIRAEVETESRMFVAHGHDVDGCDLIICWRHNWTDCPLPVLTLSVEWVNYLQMRRVKTLAISKFLDVPAAPRQLKLVDE
jgi:hypothetical protein